MTVSSIHNRQSYVGNGVTTRWPFTFDLLHADHMKVYINGSTTPLTTGYLVHPEGDTYPCTAGEVEYPGYETGTSPPVMPSPLPTGQAIDLSRELPMKQETEFPISGTTLRPDLIEKKLDELLMIIQQVNGGTPAGASIGAGGDMRREVYDTNLDGKVETAVTADSVPWSGITGKPDLSSYTHPLKGVAGTADATTTLQAYLNSGAVLTIPPGVYTVTSITVPAGATVNCFGTIKLKNGSTNHVVTMNAGSRWYGGEIDGNKANCPSGLFGFFTDRQDDIIIKDVYVHDCKDVGIEFTEMSKIVVEGCRIENCIGQAISLNFGSQARIANNFMSGCQNGCQWWGGDGAITNDRGIFDVTISGNIVQNMTGGGIWGCLGQRITVTGNTVMNVGDVGIDLENCDFFTVSGNSVKNGANGGITTFYRAASGQINGNTVMQESGMGPCIKCYGAGVSVGLSFVGNTLINTGNQPGFYADDGVLIDFVFEDNYVQVINGRGLRIADGENAVIRGNRIFVTSGSVGIDCQGFDYAQISDNYVHSSSDSSSSHYGNGGIVLYWRNATYPGKYCEVSGNTIVGFNTGINDNCWGDSASGNAIRNNRVNTIYHNGTSGWTGVATGNIMVTTPATASTVTSY